MGISKFLDPKNDYAFKKIFGTEKNKDILIHFLNDMLCFGDGKKIQTLSFLKPSLDPDIACKKQSIVDVLCTDENGCQYIVEMQVARTRGFEKRAQYYAAKAYVSQMNSGEEYHNLKEIIFLAITDFVMFPEKDEYKSDHVILDKNAFTHDLKNFSFCFLELPKFNKSIDELETMVEKWAYFFKHASHTLESDVEKITGEDFVIQKAYEVLNQFSWTEVELYTYEREKKSQLDARAIIDQKYEDGLAKGEAKGLAKGHAKGKAEGLAKGKAEGLAKGKAEGLAKGKAEGKAEGIKIVAKNLLLQGVNVEVVQMTTGLSIEEIKNLSSH